MVKDTIISAATLAGLVGLACLYQNGVFHNHLTSLRVKRDLATELLNEFEPIIGQQGQEKGSDTIDNSSFLDDEFLSEEFYQQADYDFLKGMGFLDDDISEIPEELVEDVNFYQNNNGGLRKRTNQGNNQNAKAGLAKKQISQVKNCLKNAKCAERAQKAVRMWSSNTNQYIAANPGNLLKPVNSGFQALDDTVPGSEIASDYGMCTPNDDAIPCQNDLSPLHFYNLHPNTDPTTQYSGNPALQGQVERSVESSMALDQAIKALDAKGVRDANNVFTQRSAKIFLIIPNGIPVSMANNYNANFRNYWEFFKNMNTKYFGVGVGVANRANFHVWFLRQDKNLKMIMKSPAKATGNRFPWKRFDSIMTRPQPTAVQPKLAQTYQVLHETITSKAMASESTRGKDCFTLWFHQYIPQDILGLADTLFQEETLSQVENMCTVIHIWVGMGELDEQTVRVVNYIQGILQPTQLTKTSVDPQRRRYYFVDKLEDLKPGSDKAEWLTKMIYADMAFERKRVTCLMSANSHDLGAAFERANERYDEYYAYGQETTELPAYATDIAMTADYELSYDGDELTTTVGPEEFITTPEPLEDPDYRCCGIGFHGKKYDSANWACCEDGTTTENEEDCFLKKQKDDDTLF